MFAKRGRHEVGFALAVSALLLCPGPAFAEDVPADYQPVAVAVTDSAGANATQSSVETNTDQTNPPSGATDSAAAGKVAELTELPPPVDPDAPVAVESEQAPPAAPNVVKPRQAPPARQMLPQPAASNSIPAAPSGTENSLIAPAGPRIAPQQQNNSLSRVSKGFSSGSNVSTFKAVLLGGFCVACGVGVFYVVRGGIGLRALIGK